MGHGYFCQCGGNRATQSVGCFCLERRGTMQVQREREGSEQGDVFILCLVSEGFCIGASAMVNLSILKVILDMRHKRYANYGSTKRQGRFI